MAIPLRLLIVEDNPSDAALVLHELRRAGYDPLSNRVDNEQDFRLQLHAGLEIILCDFNMPEFDSFRAFAIMRERQLDIPFIIVSGSIDEENAVEAMHRGVADYIIKDRMGRLGSAVAHALEQQEQRESKRRTEQALHDSEELSRNAFDCTHIGMAVTDLDYRFVRSNAAFSEIMGHSEQELLKISMRELTHPDDQAESEACLKGLLAGDMRYVQIEKRYIHKDKHILWGLANMSLLRDESGRHMHYVCQIQDITEHKRLGEQLRQAQKMESIGLLAGGIAHDFNNLLTVINGRSELLITRHKIDDSMREQLELIHTTGERAAALTRQLLAFSRQQVLQSTVLDLNTIVTETSEMLQRILPADIVLQSNLDQKLNPVLADSSQIEQVLLNLVVNARDAMPNGGKLVIETSNVELSESDCRKRDDIKPGHFVMVAVSDTGTGMEAAVAARIFEPFFTTKGIGKGTGLGLSTVYGIVKQSNGHITLQSELGKGTAFKVYLPRVAKTVTPTKSQPKLTAITTGNETVLLVEDDPGVRELTQDILEMKGYTVLLADNGKTALEFFVKDEKSIQLVITDIVMPEMSGPELVERLQTVRPGLKILLTSGYPDRPLAHSGALGENLNFIQKPFSAQNLANKVREILDTSIVAATQPVPVNS